MATSRTANDLVKDVLLLLNVVNPSETPSAADAQQVLQTMQDMLAEWSSNGLLVPAVTTEYFTCVAAQEEYTIGENGAPSKNTVRPEMILGMFVRVSDIDAAVDIIGEREYRLLPNKGTSTGQPDKAWVNYAAPNVTVSLYPSPDTTYTVYFVSIKPLTEPVGLTTNLLNTSLLPRNYYAAMKWNLACEVGPYFEKQPNQQMTRRALVTLNQIMAINLARTMEAVRLEIAGGGSAGNILSF